MARVTKVELAQQLAALAEDYRKARERIAALEMDLAIARKATQPQAQTMSVAKPEPAAFSDYYEYVAACRAHARRTNQRVVSYLPRNAFEAAHAPAH